MKKHFLEEYRGALKKAGCVVLAAVLLGTGVSTYRNVVSDMPELVTFVDPEIVQTEEDEVPLASAKKTTTTKKVTTKTSVKKVKMKKKAKKTATTTKKSTKSSTKTKSNSVQKVKTSTKVATTVKTKTKKNSKVKNIETKVVTTVTTTTTQMKTAQKTETKKATAPVSGTSTTSSTASAKAGTYAVRSAAPKADARVLNAFEKMGCKVVVNPAVSYSGCFDAKTRSITLKQMDSTVYHELGHFVEFVGGTSSVELAIAEAYSKEKSKYNEFNKTYVLQNSSEYFAESFKNYCENPAALKLNRPLTYQAVTEALDKITDSRINMLKVFYGSVWK